MGDGVIAITRNDIDLSDSGHSNPFAIGYSSVFGDREFAGLIDEVAIWDRALSASEVSSIYAARLDGTPAVPETAAWATMLLGLGLAGSAVRRRMARRVIA